MNAQEIRNVVETLGAIVFAILAAKGVSVPAPEQTTIFNDVSAIIFAGVSLYAIGSNFYAHWNMKKVPENSTAIATGQPLPVGTKVDVAAKLAVTNNVTDTSVVKDTRVVG